MAQLLVRHLDDDVMAKLQRRARQSTPSQLGRGGPRHSPYAVRDEGGAQVQLGSRLAARFAGLGLTEAYPSCAGT
jgi:hypothetical protein